MTAEYALNYSNDDNLAQNNQDILDLLVSSTDDDTSAVFDIPNKEKPEESQSQEEDSSLTLQITNVVAMANMKCHLKLKEIARSSVNVEYKPLQNHVIMRMRKPYTVATIWSSGKIWCTGASSIKRAHQGARRIARRLAKCGFPCRFSRYRIVNIMATCKLPFRVRLDELVKERPFLMSYEPELAPGLNFKLHKDSSTSLKLFSTGRIVVMGDSLRSISILVEELVPIAALHQTDEALTDDEKELETGRTFSKHQDTGIDGHVTGAGQMSNSQRGIFPSGRDESPKRLISRYNHLSDTEAEAMRAARLARLAVRRDRAFSLFAGCYLDEEEDEDDDDDDDDYQEGNKRRLERNKGDAYDDLRKNRYINSSEGVVGQSGIALVEDELEEEEEDIENWNSEDDTSTSDEDGLERVRSGRDADDDEDDDDSFDSGASEDSGGVSSRHRTSQMRQRSRAQTELKSTLADCNRQSQFDSFSQICSLPTHASILGSSSTVSHSTAGSDPLLWSRKAVASGSSKRACVITYHGDGSVDSNLQANQVAAQSQKNQHHQQHHLLNMQMTQQPSILSVSGQTDKICRLTAPRTPIVRVQMPRAIKSQIPQSSFLSNRQPITNQFMMSTPNRLAVLKHYPSIPVVQPSTINNLSSLPSLLQPASTGLRLVTIPSTSTSILPITNLPSSNSTTMTMNCQQPGGQSTILIPATSSCGIVTCSNIGCLTTTTTFSTAHDNNNCSNSNQNTINGVITLDPATSYMPLQMIQQPGGSDMTKMAHLPSPQQSTSNSYNIPHGTHLTVFSSNTAASRPFNVSIGSPCILSNGSTMPLQTSGHQPVNLDLSGGLINQSTGQYISPVNSTACVTGAIDVNMSVTADGHLLTPTCLPQTTVFNITGGLQQSSLVSLATPALGHNNSLVTSSNFHHSAPCLPVSQGQFSVATNRLCEGISGQSSSNGLILPLLSQSVPLNSSLVHFNTIQSGVSIASPTSLTTLPVSTLCTPLTGIGQPRFLITQPTSSVTILPQQFMPGLVTGQFMTEPGQSGLISSPLNAPQQLFRFK